MNNVFLWILSLSLFLSLSHLQAQREGSWAILLHSESGVPLCRIGERVNQDFLPESLLDETTQLQDLEECSDEQILLAAVETDWENIPTANSLPFPLAIPLLFSTGVGFQFGCFSLDSDTQKQFVTSQDTSIHKVLIAIPKVFGIVGMGTVLYLFAPKHKKLLALSYLGSLVGGRLFCSTLPQEEDDQ